MHPKFKKSLHFFAPRCEKSAPRCNEVQTFFALGVHLGASKCKFWARFFALGVHLGVRQVLPGAWKNCNSCKIHSKNLIRFRQHACNNLPSSMPSHLVPMPTRLPTFPGVQGGRYGFTSDWIALVSCNSFGTLWAQCMLDVFYGSLAQVRRVLI